MSDTDLCARCGGDCGMSKCRECGGCENTGPGGTFRECPSCAPEAVEAYGVEDDEWDDDRDRWDDDE